MFLVTFHFDLISSSVYLPEAIAARHLSISSFLINVSFCAARLPSSSPACKANRDCKVYLLKYVIALPNFWASKFLGSLIDDSTEGIGGNLYQDARKLRANYAREFENVGVVDKLLSKKAGTTDRAVALEDVFNHAILKGSVDDVRAISRTLKRAGPEGQQAYRELLAQTLEHMREGITKNIQRDANNNPIVSA